MMEIPQECPKPVFMKHLETKLNTLTSACSTVGGGDGFRANTKSNYDLKCSWERGQLLTPFNETYDVVADLFEKHKILISSARHFMFGYAEDQDPSLIISLIRLG